MATAEQIAALYRTHFPAFLRFAFHELHPGQRLVEATHIDILADHLDRIARGEITRLIINMPPRSLKSFSASIALPTWLLGKDPTRQIMSVAGTRELAADFETATRTLVAAPRCRALFPHLKLEGRPGDLRSPHGGRRIAATVGGTLIGRGADLIVVDDPIAPAHVHDTRRRKAVKTWFDAEVIQRLNNKETGAVIVVMQRLHVDDLAGHLLGGEQPWVHLNMPAIATSEEKWALSNGRAYVREKGHALAPHIEGRQQLFDRMLDIGAYNFGAQYQQAPFEHMNEDEARGGCFGGPDDEWGFPAKWFGMVPESVIMAYELFGVGKHHPAAPAREITAEEFERYSRWCEDYQRRLQDDPAAEFGPPAGETWPPDPDAPPPAPWVPPDEEEEVE
ncbi:MAG: hypothetical protein CTY20_00905 [Hyphomicrobium sp.]|nr:MAG: hypothetical protein CTY20_00905 [Hyphomicrobium sp.]